VIQAKLRECLKQSCLLVGIGNPLRGDDAFGPLVIEALRGNTKLPLLDVGSAPENFIGPLTRTAPAHIILLDAVSLEAPPGSLHWLEPSELEPSAVSTHAPSLDLLVSLIKQCSGETRVHILGVVPSQVGFGDRLSDQTRQAVEQVTSMIAQLAPPDQDPRTPCSPSDRD